MYGKSILIPWLFYTTFFLPYASSDIGCVPIAGLGIVADPQIFFPRLANSIDFCIDNFILVKTTHLNLTDGINILKLSPHIKNLTVIIRENYLFSVSEGWNTILKTYPDSAWFLILAYDIELRPGQLELMSSRFWDQSETHVINSNYTSARNHIPPLLLVFSNYENADVAACAFNIFGFTNQVIQDIGYFDENLFPVLFIIKLCIFYFIIVKYLLRLYVGRRFGKTPTGNIVLIGITIIVEVRYILI